MKDYCEDIKDKGRRMQDNMLDIKRNLDDKDSYNYWCQAADH